MGVVYKTDSQGRGYWDRAPEPFPGTVSAPGYQFGDIGSRAGNDTLDAAKAVLLGDGTVTRSMLPESVQQFFPPELGGIADGVLGGLLGVVGYGEKGIGYGAEIFDAGARGLAGAVGAQWPYAPGTSAQKLMGDVIGGLDAYGAGPEGRMIEALVGAARPAISGAMRGAPRGAPMATSDAAAALTAMRPTSYNIGDLLSAARSGSYVPQPGKPGTVTIPGFGQFDAMPISPIEEAAREYMLKRGIADFGPVSSYPAFDEDRARMIARAYEMMKHDPSDPLVKRAFDAMIQETLDQYNALKGTGIDFRFLKDGMSDPYARSPALGYKDMVENGRLFVFPTDFGFGSTSSFDPATNPLLTRVGRIGDKPDAVANDAFRIVHDAFGHFGPGNPLFRHQGEERAWLEHSRMYSPEARGAMTSETRGQNSWLNFGPFGEQNRAALGGDTIFADQKTGLMPEWTWGLLGPQDEQAAIAEWLDVIGGR